MEIFSIKKAVPDSNKSISPVNNAFLIYRPKSSKSNEEVFYNQEASGILSRSLKFSGKKQMSSFRFCSFCYQWKELLEKKATEKKEGNPSAYLLDTLKSDRRLYAVRGLRLSNHQSTEDIGESRFIFILERMQSEKINLSLIARQFNLNQREQEIIQLLTEERANKEIAEALGLSLNTIKSYIKILMRKLGVSSRAGIITCLLTKR